MLWIVAFTLAAALLASGAPPEDPPVGEGPVGPGGDAGLQRLLGGLRRGTHGARIQRRAHLSEDEREIMTKQIMQALSEVIHADCMPDRDYQGWVDFGRRNVE